MELCCHQTQLNMEFTLEQNQALQAIYQFLASDNQVFILRGSAGTGKTTLLEQVVKYVDAKHMPYYLMAPTGRAAHILANKTGQSATTIHRCIYDLEKLEVLINDDDIAKSEFKFHYPIRVNDEVAPISIVDEGSMIGNRYSEGELWSFGTNHLLDDLLTFAKLNKKGKLIVVGDPYQLPPVKEAESSALQESFFQIYGYKVLAFDLQEVHRQNANSLLLENAIFVRKCCEQKQYNQLKLQEGDEVTSIVDSEVAKQYTSLFSTPELGNSVVICYSNATAIKYNEQIRNIYFNDNANHLQNDDVMMVVNNHYDRQPLTDQLPCDIMNGEFVKVIEWSNEEIHVVPVYENNKKIQLSITFVDVTLLLQSGNVYKCKMITEPILSAQTGTVSTTLIKALYIDFCIRHPEIVKNRKKEPIAFADALQSDRYINALRTRYGYAITCHKSQGGEWSDVFVDFEGVRFNALGARWMYTAITRPRRHIYMIKFSNVSPTQELVFNAVVQSSQPNKYFPLPEPTFCLESPYHTPDASVYLLNKYSEVKRLLENTNYHISNVQSLPYRERYTISSNEGVTYTIDYVYNGKGIFRTPTISNESLRQILEQPIQEPLVYPPLDYEPSNNVAQYLFDTMMKACSDTDVKILKVVEQLEHYVIIYCLQTSSKYASITFAINAKGFITYGAPNTESIPDSKLDHLLLYLRDLVN